MGTGRWIESGRLLDEMNVRTVGYLVMLVVQWVYDMGSLLYYDTIGTYDYDCTLHDWGIKLLSQNT